MYQENYLSQQMNWIWILDDKIYKLDTIHPFVLPINVAIVNHSSLSIEVLTSTDFQKYG